MRFFILFSVCLLSTDAAVWKKTKRAHNYRVREVGASDDGYNYPRPAANVQLQLPQYQTSVVNGVQYQPQTSVVNGVQYQPQVSAVEQYPPISVGNQMTVEQHNEMVNTHAETAVTVDSGRSLNYQYEAPSPAPAISSQSTSILSQAPAEIQGLAGALESHVESAINSDSGSTFSTGSIGSAGSSGTSFDLNNLISGSSGTSLGNNFNTGSSYNFDSSVGTSGGNSGSNDQFMAVQGEVIGDNPPSIFKYKPHFGGKDINNLPHILPPGGKSIQQLQDEADGKLRAIVEKAKMNQQQVLDRISKLRSNYGYGTLGFDGFKDTRFKKTGEIDLGSHRAVDLGTSIDYNALKAPNGKLKLPIQNVYHTKTLGIHIPQPYPVKHEVPVPAPFPVPHPVPYPQHKPTAFSPLNPDEVVNLSANDHSDHTDHHFNPMLESHGDDNAFSIPTGNNAPHHFGATFSGFGGSFSGFGGGRGVKTEGGSSTFTIEPSQAISETSEVGGEVYGAGTPNSGGTPISGDEEQIIGSQPSFGIAPGSSSVGGGGGNYVIQSSGGNYMSDTLGRVTPSAEYGVPAAAASTQSISSEAGQVAIPSMDFSPRKISPSLRLLQRFHSADGKAKRYLHNSQPPRY